MFTGQLPKINLEMTPYRRQCVNVADHLGTMGLHYSAAK